SLANATAVSTAAKSGTRSRNRSEYAPTRSASRTAGSIRSRGRDDARASAWSSRARWRSTPSTISVTRPASRGSRDRGRPSRGAEAKAPPSSTRLRIRYASRRGFGPLKPVSGGELAPRRGLARRHDAPPLDLDRFERRDRAVGAGQAEAFE